MPFTNTWETDGLYRKFTGVISGEEILASNFELHVEPRFQKIKYVINDFTDITGHSIETGHTKIYATTDEIISNTKGKLKIALIVIQDPLIPLANSYRDQMVGKLFECEIFKTLDKARQWVE